MTEVGSLSVCTPPMYVALTSTTCTSLAPPIGYEIPHEDEKDGQPSQQEPPTLTQQQLVASNAEVKVATTDTIYVEDWDEAMAAWDALEKEIDDAAAWDTIG